MNGTTALNAYNDSIRRTVPEVVDDLRVALGAKLVAYIAGVSETRTVREWAEATRRPTPAAEERIRLAHRIVTLIGQSEGVDIVPTWFQGMNPQLEDRSPARVLREDSFDEAGGRVLAAASAFVGATDEQQSAVESPIPWDVVKRDIGVAFAAAQPSRAGRKSKGDRQLLGTRPPAPLAAAARKRAEKLGMTVSDYLVTLLARDLNLPEFAPQPDDAARGHL